MSPRQIPSELVKRYTMDGRVMVMAKFIKDGPVDPVTSDQWDALKSKAKAREENYYKGTDNALYFALNELKLPVDARWLIVGSRIPWYEAVAIQYGGGSRMPIDVLEYAPRQTMDDRVRYIIERFDPIPDKTYDIILSISSTEHSGLGRYGDPLDPDGDLKDMEKFRMWLKDDGKLVLAVPLGKDCLCWNAHRVYGTVRLPWLLREWNLVQSYGYDPEMLEKDMAQGWYQPVFVLEK